MTPIGMNRKQVYVDIPPSPLLQARRKSVNQRLSDVPSKPFLVAGSLESTVVKPRVDVLLSKPLNIPVNQPLTQHEPSTKKRKHQNDVGIDPVKRRRPYNKDVSDNTVTTSQVQLGPVTDVKPPRAPKPKKIPTVTWNRVITTASREDIEDRIYLREFVLRFSPLLKIAQKHADTLADFDNLTEVTLKGVLVGLLDLIRADSDEPEKKGFSQALKSIKASSHTLKFWQNLDRLRQSSGLHLPDPAVPIGEGRTTRAGTQMLAIQLLPCLLALCEVVLQMASIRNDIDTGLKEMPQNNREYHGKIKAEMERWATVKKPLTDAKKALDKKNKAALFELQNKIRTLEEKHKDVLRSLKTKHSIASRKCALRYRPFMDPDGRVYYIPSVPSGRIPNNEDRLTRWAWFVAVWGKRPNEPGDAMGDEDEEDAWWGFGDPAQIKNLVKWLEWKADPKGNEQGLLESADVVDISMDSEDGTTKGDGSWVKPLCKSLTDFADFLELKTNELEK